MLGVQSMGPARTPVVAAVATGAISDGSGTCSAGSLEPGDPGSVDGGSTGAGNGGVGSGNRAASTGAPAIPGPQNATVELRPADAAAAEREGWLVLMTVPGLGPVTFTGLLGTFGSAVATLAVATAEGGETRLRQALARSQAARDGEWGDEPQRAGGLPDHRPARGQGSELARRICEYAARGDEIVGRVRTAGLVVLTLDDAAYPERLRTIEMPPPLLFVRGSIAALSQTHAVAIVGTRRATERGRRVAGWLASAVARAGAVVVSGLAFGIDGAAHAAVVGEGRPTVAVLGGGHGCLYPRAHERLAEEIVEAGGAVISELSPDTAATRGTFPRRNRLISGLAEATVVVEAGRHSGALITASWALEQGRDCFLVPGPLDSEASAGCHEFLRAFPGQARIVAGVPELIEDLGLVAASEPQPGAAGGSRADTPEAGREAVLASLGPVERSLAEALAAGAATADQLARHSGLSTASILSALTMLELRGLASSAYGRYRASGILARWSPDLPAALGES